MVKNPPCNAKDDKGSIPGVGTNIPHAPEQGSPQVTAKIPGASTNTQCSQINKYFKTEKDIEHLMGAGGSKKNNYKCQEDNYKPQQELCSPPRSPANGKHLGCVSKLSTSLQRTFVQNNYSRLSPFSL